MFTETSIETVPLTLQIAKHYARMNTLRGDRDPESKNGQRRLAWLYSILRRGYFHSPVWAVAKVTKEKGKQYRVDGGHSSHMLAFMANSDFPENLQVTIRHFTVNDIQGAMVLYEQFNQSHSTRSFTDLVKNRAGYESKLAGISPTVIGIAARAIVKHLEFRNPKESFNPLEVIHQYPDFIAWSNPFLGTRKMKRTPAVAAMFSTCATNVEVATEFWTLVRDESATDPKDATRTLHAFLKEISGNTMEARLWDQRAIYVKCHHAWNAWRKGIRTNLKYTKGAPLPDAM